MGGRNRFKVFISLFVLLLTLTVVVQSANAAYNLEKVRCWYWNWAQGPQAGAAVQSVATGDVDADGQVEVVTGGWYFDWDYSGQRPDNYNFAQLCVWNGATMAPEKVITWEWGATTCISAVALGDVDRDRKMEIVTGGWYWDKSVNSAQAQLCVWDGATLELENVATWTQVGDTYIQAIAIGNVDDDPTMEIVTTGHTGGEFGFSNILVWDGITLKHENGYADDGYGHVFFSVAIGDVDGDAQAEIVTGGRSAVYNYYQYPAELCVWEAHLPMELENIKTWMWNGWSEIRSVAIGEVNGLTGVDIVTGGWSYVLASPSIVHQASQLCVWDGSTLALRGSKTWDWGSYGINQINSVAIRGVGIWAEIVTAGYYWDNDVHPTAQLCSWRGYSMALNNVVAWKWGSDTDIPSVSVDDIDGDGQEEIITGGYYKDSYRSNAQVCVWS